MRFSYKKYSTQDERMLAICDSEILGRKLEEEDICIEVSEEFYSDKECGEKEAVELIASSTIVNAVGRNIVNVMIDNRLADNSSVLYIRGVPHVQTVCL